MSGWSFDEYVKAWSDESQLNIVFLNGLKLVQVCMI